MSEITTAPVTFSVEDAAGLLGVYPSWLAKQARDGKVPHRRLGRRVRFTQGDVDAILAAHARGAVDPNSWGLAPRRKRKSA